MKKFLNNNIVIVGLTFIIPGFLALICKNSFSTYKDLIQPKLAPPAVVFPIVWSILYLLMSISIIKVKHSDNNLKLYYTQLLLNAIWTPIFFMFKLYFLALVDLVLLIIAVIYMAYEFYLDNKISGYLLIPYIAWNFFALYLNFFIFLYN